jgi:mRNA interferase RelE/StbE
VASYRVFIKPSAAKELEGVPLRDRRRLVARIARLAADPRPRGCEKLTGAERYRIRQGAWRVLYAIEDDVVRVVVVEIGHRREVDR